MGFNCTAVCVCVLAVLVKLQELEQVLDDAKVDGETLQQSAKAKVSGVHCTAVCVCVRLLSSNQNTQRLKRTLFNQD